MSSRRPFEVCVRGSPNTQQKGGALQRCQKLFEIPPPPCPILQVIRIYDGGAGPLHALRRIEPTSKALPNNSALLSADHSERTLPMASYSAPLLGFCQREVIFNPPQLGGSGTCTRQDNLDQGSARRRASQSWSRHTCKVPYLKQVLFGCNTMASRKLGSFPHDDLCG